MCSDALEDEPECLPLLLIRARAQLALRRELDAQADLRDVIRLDPDCSTAFRLLGVLAARRDELGPAAVFFREAVRLDPGDREARDWLLTVDKPAPRREPARMARGTEPAPARAGNALQTSAKMSPRPEPSPVPSYDMDERPTKPFARGSARDGDQWRTPQARPVVAQPGAQARSAPQVRPRVRTAASDAPTDRPDATPWPDEPAPRPTITGHPPTQPPAKEAPRLVPRGPARTSRAATPELPGFGEYLVSSGILSIERLRAAQAYQRSMKVQLSTAIVTLGLATPQRIEWAAVSHQSQLARKS
ncbi:MAG TPA: hypothetical protein VGC42_13805 [Kofleriaceae bacterium]